jgi:hypothetical protein
MDRRTGIFTEVHPLPPGELNRIGYLWSHIKDFLRACVFLAIIELRINKETRHLLLKGRGDFSRPDFGRLKPPLPKGTAPKRSFITFAKLNSSWIAKRRVL